MTQACDGKRRCEVQACRNSMGFTPKTCPGLRHELYLHITYKCRRATTTPKKMTAKRPVGAAVDIVSMFMPPETQRFSRGLDPGKRPAFSTCKRCGCFKRSVNNYVSDSGHFVKGYQYAGQARLCQCAGPGHQQASGVSE